MRKDIVSWLLQLMLVGALVFVGWELHRMNGRLNQSFDVSVSSDSYSLNGIEVEIKKPVKIDADSYDGLPVRIER